MSGAIIMAVTYGYNAKQSGDRFISVAKKAAGIMSELTLPGAHLVTDFPLRMSLN